MNTSNAPQSWPASESAYYIVCRHCAGAVYASTDSSYDVQGSTHFNANEAEDDGGKRFSEELDCAEVVAWDRVTSSSISDFRFILVLYRLEPTINDADPVE